VGGRNNARADLRHLHLHIVVMRYAVIASRLSGAAIQPGGEAPKVWIASSAFGRLAMTAC
jgi:hypothetical protein